MQLFYAVPIPHGLSGVHNYWRERKVFEIFLRFVWFGRHRWCATSITSGRHNGRLSTASYTVIHHSSQSQGQSGPIGFSAAAASSEDNCDIFHRVIQALEGRCLISMFKSGAILWDLLSDTAEPSGPEFAYAELLRTIAPYLIYRPILRLAKKSLKTITVLGLEATMMSLVADGASSFEDAWNAFRCFADERLTFKINYDKRLSDFSDGISGMVCSNGPVRPSPLRPPVYLYSEIHLSKNCSIFLCISVVPEMIHLHGKSSLISWVDALGAVLQYIAAKNAKRAIGDRDTETHVEGSRPVAQVIHSYFTPPFSPSSGF